MAGTDSERVKGAGFGPSFLTPLILGAVLNPINSTALATALTPIGRAFPNDPGAVAWLIAALYLTASIAQPVLGRVADMFGPRRTLLAGMAVVCLGGLIGAVATSIGMLVLSRAVIGIGTSAGYPCAFALIRARARSLGVDPPPRVLAVLSVAGNVSATLGPPLGGLIVSTLGWRWVFVVNFPLAVIGLMMAVRNLPPDPPPRSIDVRGLDLPGIGLFSGAMLGLLLFLMGLRRHFDPAPLVIAAGFLAALTFVELRRVAPFIDVRMLASNGGLRAIYLRHAMTSAITYALFYSLPQWMQQTQGRSPAQTGVLMLPFALMGAASTFLVTRPRWTRLTRVIGGGATALGCGWILLLGRGAGMGELAVLIGVFGVASGALSMFNQQGLMRQAPPEQTGAAAGLFRTAQYVGAMVAAALVGFVLRSRADDAALHMLALVFLPLAGLMIVLLATDRKDAPPAKRSGGAVSEAD